MTSRAVLIGVPGQMGLIQPIFAPTEREPSATYAFVLHCSTRSSASSEPLPHPASLHREYQITEAWLRSRTASAPTSVAGEP